MYKRSKLNNKENEAIPLTFVNLNSNLTQQHNLNNTCEITHKFRPKSSKNISLKKQSLKFKYMKPFTDKNIIDIVQRKIEPLQICNSSISNIQRLKRQIQYLEEQKPNWDRFPMAQKFNSTNTLEKGGKNTETSMISLNEYFSQTHKSLIIKQPPNIYFQSSVRSRQTERDRLLKVSSLQRKTASCFKAQVNGKGNLLQILDATNNRKSSICKLIHIQYSKTKLHRYWSHSKSKKAAQNLLHDNTIIGRKISKLCEYSSQNFISI